MKRLISTHKERVQKVKNFTEKNKLFTVIAIVIVILLFSNFFFSKENENKIETENETVQSETVEDTENLQWRFYWTDLWVLLGAGGFCTVMIIQERKKAKEELQ